MAKRFSQGDCHYPNCEIRASRRPSNGHRITLEPAPRRPEDPPVLLPTAKAMAPPDKGFLRRLLYGKSYGTRIAKIACRSQLRRLPLQIGCHLLIR